MRAPMLGPRAHLLHVGLPAKLLNGRVQLCRRNAIVTIANVVKRRTQVFWPRRHRCDSTRPQVARIFGVNLIYERSKGWERGGYFMHVHQMVRERWWVVPVPHTFHLRGKGRDT